MDALVAPASRAKRARRGDRPPAPNVVIGSADALVFQKLNQHGPLPRSLIEPFTAHQRPSERYSQNRLALLTNTRVRKDDPDSPGYLWRPGQKYKTVGMNKHEMYANTVYADEYLLARDLASQPSTAINKNNLHHESFLGAISASIDIGCLWNPRLELFSEHQLLPRAPSGSREIPCEISHDYSLWDKEHNGWRTDLRYGNTSLIPDAYFAIKQELEDGPDYRAFFLEVDCGTEMLTRYDLNEKSWRATLLKYRHIFQRGKYKDHFGLTCDAYVLIVTTSLRQMHSIQRILLQDTGGKGSPYILFQTWTDFIEELYIPKEPRLAFINEPWQRVGVNTKTNQPYTHLYLVMPSPVAR